MQTWRGGVSLAWSKSDPSSGSVSSTPSPLGHTPIPLDTPHCLHSYTAQKRQARSNDGDRRQSERFIFLGFPTRSMVNRTICLSFLVCLVLLLFAWRRGSYGDLTRLWEFLDKDGEHACWLINTTSHPTPLDNRYYFCSDWKTGYGTWLSIKWCVSNFLCL